jgi:hypothetical protein
LDKIPTLFVRDERFRVTPVVTPGCEWVLAGEGVATEKLDGTNIRITAALHGGALHVGNVEKRRKPSREEAAAGIEPGYVPASDDDPADRWIMAAARGMSLWTEGTIPHEAIGPKIQGNPLGLMRHTAVPLLVESLPVYVYVARTFEGLREWTATQDSLYSPGHPAEGVVFHHPDGRMAKIKRKDFAR